MTLFQIGLGWKRRRVGLRLGLLMALAQSLGIAAANVEPPTLPRKQPTADHRQFDILKQEFKSGPEVTAACLSCHTEAQRSAKRAGLRNLPWRPATPASSQVERSHGQGVVPGVSHPAIGTGEADDNVVGLVADGPMRCHR